VFRPGPGLLATSTCSASSCSFRLDRDSLGRLLFRNGGAGGGSEPRRLRFIPASGGLAAPHRIPRSFIGQDSPQLRDIFPGQEAVGLFAAFAQHRGAPARFRLRRPSRDRGTAAALGRPATRLDEMAGRSARSRERRPSGRLCREDTSSRYVLPRSGRRYRAPDSARGNRSHPRLHAGRRAGRHDLTGSRLHLKS